MLPDEASGKIPRLLLHCCCAPCAGYALEHLSPLYSITTLFYNPNIRPREEFDKRAAELGKLLSLAQYPNRIDSLCCDYSAEAFELAAEPYWDEPEGGRRCKACFALRLFETAARAKACGYSHFATTLSVSPHKNVKLLGETGAAAAKEYGVGYLHLDLKKRDGYKRSIELSKHYGLYRQSYCGCKINNK